MSIGDVGGHGLDAAVIAGLLRHIIFAECLDNDDPAAILVNADRALHAQTETIATALVAFIDTQNGKMTYASAGHPAPIVAAPKQSAAFLADGSAPLGTGFVSGRLMTETHEYQLTPNTLLVFYTDGITEFNRNIAQGEARLLAAAQAVANGEVAMSALPSCSFAGKRTSCPRRVSTKHCSSIGAFIQVMRTAHRPRATS